MNKQPTPGADAVNGTPRSKPKMKNRHLNSSTKKSGSKIKPKKRKRESDYSSDDSDIVNSDFDDES